MSHLANISSRNPIPAKAGIGLRAEHFADVLGSDTAKSAWLEIHIENYLCDGGPKLRQLETIRRNYPLSFHGVSLSLGSAGRLDQSLLQATKKLINRLEPALLSEHLSWSGVRHGTAGGFFLNDLLPLPYTREALEVMADHVDEAQEVLGRQILIENPSAYLGFANNEYSEAEFLTELASRTGCGLLLDVNNIYVSARNMGFDPVAALEAVPGDLVGEIHLAGHATNMCDGVPVLIDDHGSEVSGEVWSLFRRALAQIGAKPTLIEWDSNIPAIAILQEQARIADREIEQMREPGHEA